MKRFIAGVALLVVVVGAGVLWVKVRPGNNHGTEEKPAAGEEEKKSRVARDESGNVVIKMDDETQGNMGLLVAKPVAASLNPEVKGYGRVLDPTPLALLSTELASAQASSSASSNELVRLKTLAGLANASARALQTAEAAALHDQLAVQSAQSRMALAWGAKIAAQTNLADLVQSLTAQESALVRVDLAAGDVLRSAPTGARICTLGGESAKARFWGVASSTDPQTLGQGYIFLLQPNSLRLRPVEAVVGYVEVPGEPLVGVLVPNEAVVRAEGAGWIYVLDKGGDAFTRTKVALDHPSGSGWVVTNGISTNQYIVVTGAQTLLSEELKASLKAD